jgi:hypothetical protein
MKVRVTIDFSGKVAGSLGVSSNFQSRRTIEVPSPFTYEEAKEAARVSLYYSDGDDKAYQSVTVKNIMFN